MKTLSEACAQHRYQGIGNDALSKELYQSWTHTYLRYRSLVFQLCLSRLGCPFDAEDATMDIFAGLPHQISRYRIRYFRAWLLQLSKNHCRQLLAAKRRQQAILTQWSYRHAVCRDPLSEKRWQEERLKYLRQAVIQLKGQQRDCIISFYLEGLSYREVSRNLQLPLRSVKSHIQNGKRNLQRLMPVECRYCD